MTHKKEPTHNSYSLLTTLLPFFSLVLLGVVIWSYYNLVVGSIITITSVAYLFLKKYYSTKPIDDLLKRIFSNKTSVIVFCSVLIFISMIIIVHKEFHIFSNNLPKISQRFNGTVWDEENEPLNGVIVFLPELDIYDTTDNNGKFSFPISDTNLVTVSLIAQKEGYKTYEAEGSVENPNYNFNMIKK